MTCAPFCAFLRASATGTARPSGGRAAALPSLRTRPIFGAMAKSPDKSRRRDPRAPTRAKAARPDAPPTPDALADLLNPAINKGTAGLGPSTGKNPNLTPPPETSWERRQDFSAAHTARKSLEGFLARRRSRITPPRRSPGSIRRWRKNWAWATRRTLPLPCRGEGRAAKAGGVGQPRANSSPPPDRPPPREREALSKGEVKKDDAKYRLPRADLPTQPGGFAGIASQQSLDRLLREGRPEFAAQPWTPHRPPRPEKSEGGVALQDRLRLRAAGRPAAGDQGTGRGRPAPRPHAGAARRHRLGQDLHHGQGDRGDAAPGADPGAQQDAGRAALRRVQVVLSRQRGGIFRLLLRLLPAGSLRPAHRHLYREGILHQRADRPHAPFGHARAARARRRHHRRLGVLHLRHRLGRDLFGHDLHAQAGRQDRPAPAHRRPGRAAIQAHGRRFLPRLVPRARRHARHLPGALRGPRLARASVRRRDREDRGDGPAHRRQDRRAGIRQGLRQFALRHAAPDADPGHERHQGRAARAPRAAQRRRPPAGSAAAGAAHRLRPGNDGGDRLLRRHRELFALSHRPQAGRAAADAVRIRARQRAGVLRREPRHRAAARRHVPRRLPPQGDAGRIRLPPALLHGQPAAALRGMGRHAPADRRRLGHARRLGAQRIAAACSSSR